MQLNSCSDDRTVARTTASPYLHTDAKTSCRQVSLRKTAYRRNWKTLKCAKRGTSRGFLAGKTLGETFHLGKRCRKILSSPSKLREVPCFAHFAGSRPRKHRARYRDSAPARSNPQHSESLIELRCKRCASLTFPLPFPYTGRRWNQPRQGVLMAGLLAR